MTQSELEGSLSVYEAVRDLGQAVLIVGLICEILIVTFLHGKGRSEVTASIVAVLIIIAGVAVENVASGHADRIVREMRSPRFLTSVQKEQIVEKVKSLPAMAFDVAASLEREPLALVIQIEDVLTKAGWKELDWTGSGNIIRRSGRPRLGLGSEAEPVGVSVQVELSQGATLLPIAKKLASAIATEGIAAEAEFMPAPETQNHDAIHIVVSEKP